MGCKWATFSNSRGSTTFPTCPYNSDPINFLNAGFAAAQYGSSASHPAVNFLDKHFEGGQYLRVLRRSYADSIQVQLAEVYRLAGMLSQHFLT